jgi:hypothetical protein
MPTEEEISAFINGLAKQGAEEPRALAAAPEEREEKAAQTLEEIIAQVKAEEEAEREIEAAEKAASEENIEAPAVPEIAEAPKTEQEKAQSESAPNEETERAIIIPSNRRSSRKKKKQLASVLEMLREYEEEDARKIPKIEAQLMLNLDDITASLIESPKK